MNKHTVAIAIFLSLVTATLAGAAVPSTAQPTLLDVGVVRHAQALVDDLRSAEPAEAVRLVAAEAGYEVGASKAEALTLDEALTRLGADADTAPDAPAALEAPLARILSAVVAARDLRDDAFADLTPDEQAFLAENAVLSMAPTGGALDAPAAAAADAHVDILRVGPHPLDEEARALVEALAARVDAARLAQAEAVVLDAVMASIPALEDAAEALALEGLVQPAAHTCDVFQHASYVCVRGLGADDWHDDYWVAIDLGGSDHWTNNQGANRGISMPVALALDLRGDDRYTSIVSGTTTSHALATQGAGVIGVGALVDVAGSDTYTARVTLTPPPLAGAAPFATVVAQGAAVTGAGALVDLAGSNFFDAAASTLGGPAVTVAQGAAALAGVGLLGGNPDIVGTDQAFGSGYAASASSDVLLVAASGTSRSFVIGGALTLAQGGANLGAGALVDLDGHDTYSARSSGGDAATIGQGGALGGAGVLVDAHGFDRMTAEASGSPTLESRWRVTCPAGFTCSFRGEVHVTMGRAFTVAQGAVNLGLGVLADLSPLSIGGAHTVIASAAPVGRAIVEWGGGGGSPGTLTAIADVISGDADAHAHGYGGAGAGVALGGVGNDAYTMITRTRPVAEATSVGGEPSIADAIARAGDANGRGQGYAAVGAGILVDPSGDDRYDAKGSSSAIAIENGLPGTAVSGTPTWAGRGHAASPGTAVVADLHGLDAWSPVPGTSYPGGQNECWTNSAPGVPGSLDTRIGIGVDHDLLGLPAPSCLPPSN